MRRPNGHHSPCLVAMSLAAAVSFMHLAAGCSTEHAWRDEPIDALPMSDAVCAGDLRSWVVAGRGRHLYLDITCPLPNDHLSGVVEFASTTFRQEYDWTIDDSHADRISRMTPGVRILPAFPPADNRLEASYELTVEQAACLQRDRVFANRYFLLGPNSNSAMRAACDACDVQLPDHVQSGGGVLGEFPGINMDPGVPIPRSQWRLYGMPDERESPADSR